MTNKGKIHFIAIGGSIMHNLAIDTKLKGFEISGSDDEIFEPALSGLAKHQILPEKHGWFPEKITSDLEMVIVGMHARSDNPELLKAQELGLKIYSFPQFIYQQSEDKQRVVIAGSHGKTTITAIIMHVLKFFNRKFDYLVGANLEGFEQMVKISDDAPLIIIEGDEYLTAPFDPTPKFLHYNHHIGLISGIAWDHMNVFPTIDAYIAPFEIFADATPKAGSLVLSQEDSLVSMIAAKERADVVQVQYQAHPHKIIEGTTYLTYKGDRIPIQIFGEHNLKNISGAKQVCLRIGIHEDDFYKAIISFKGAAKRLEKVAEKNNFFFFKDYAHAPSKVLATTIAVKKQFVERKLIACLELHTFSSLSKDFLPQYEDTLNVADTAVIYYNPKSIELKKMPHLSKEDIIKGFDHENLKIFDSLDELKDFLLGLSWHNKNLLMMSSGSFDNLDFHELATQLTEKV